MDLIFYRLYYKRTECQAYKDLRRIVLPVIINSEQKLLSKTIFISGSGSICVVLSCLCIVMLQHTHIAINGGPGRFYVTLMPKCNKS